MAVLYAARSFRQPDAIVTFGCPRVGDSVFASAFNQNFAEVSLRFVNNNDAVTRIPWKAMGFSHVWRQHYFDAKGNLHADYRPRLLAQSSATPFKAALPTSAASRLATALSTTPSKTTAASSKQPSVPPASRPAPSTTASQTNP